jgi:hypothetical protein
VIRGIVGHAFLRWGIAGALCALVFVGLLFWWALSALWWLVEGALFVAGLIAGAGYLVLLIALVLWLRGRRRSDHLLEYGRRRWPE